MNHLPRVLAEIAAVAGEDAALTIARDHGGTQVHIPLEPTPDHWLSQLIGHPEATTVAAALACRMGLRINVPFGPIGAQKADAPTHRPAASSGSGSGVLDDFAEVIGEQAAFALAEEFMGERVYMPKYPAGEPRIAEAIGEDQARNVCDVFWGTVVTFPSKVVIERRAIDLAEQGLPKREIARRLKIRQARVFDILRRQRVEG